MAKARFLTDEEFELAAERGREAEPYLIRIQSVVYQPHSDKFQFDFSHGATLLIPRACLQWVSEATRDQILHFELQGQGTSIWWPELDAAFSAVGLLEGRWGTPGWTKKLRESVAQPISA